MRQKKIWKAVRIVSYIALVFGLALLAYFPVTNYLDGKAAQKALASMEHETLQMDDSEKKALLENAFAYNERLAGNGVPGVEIMDYADQLALKGSEKGAFASILIPKINVAMPVYHGTSEEVLAVGAGHLEDTSLPVGGTSALSALCAHSGMRNLTAFDNLDQLKEGDVFGYKILGDLYCYKIDSIKTVLPEEVSDEMKIIPGQDRSTLITCTPYGINTHRLLVSGVRCTVPDNFEQTVPSISVLAKDRRNFPLILALMIILFAVFAGVLARLIRRRRHL